MVAVRGSVVDIRFETHLPPIYSLLRAMDGKVAMEVLAQLDAQRIRGIALTPTQGLARGMAVEDTGGPLKAPVGKEILARLADVGLPLMVIFSLPNSAKNVTPLVRQIIVKSETRRSPSITLRKMHIVNELCILLLPPHHVRGDLCARQSAIATLG